jgi:hypothetical protein
MKKKKTYTTPATEVISIHTLPLLIVSGNDGQYYVDVEEDYNDEPIL